MAKERPGIAPQSSDHDERLVSPSCPTQEELQGLLYRALGGDPLGVEKLVTRFLRDSALILNHELLVERTRQRLAHHVGAWELDAIENSLIQACIEDAVQHVLDEDLEALQEQLPDDTAGRERFEYMIEVLGVPVGRARDASVNFNALPVGTRRAFRHVVLDHEDWQGLIGDDWESESVVRAAVLSGLGVILGRGQGDPMWSSQA